MPLAVTQEDCLIYIAATSQRKRSLSLIFVGIQYKYTTRENYALVTNDGTFASI